MRAVEADVLHHAHVDDRDAAVRAAGVVHLPQRVDQRRAVRHALLPRVDGDAEAGGGGGAGGIGGLAARTRAGPSRCRGRSRRGRSPQPSGVRSATHSQTLPASCSAPNGRAPCGCAVTGTVQPQPLSAQLQQRLVEHVAPRLRRGRRAPRASASHSSAVGSARAGPTPQNASASASVTSVAGWSASCGSSRLRRAVAASCALTTGQRPISTRPSSTVALLARLAERVAPGGQLHERVERWTITSYDRDRRIIARERPGGKRLQRLLDDRRAARLDEHDHAVARAQDVGAVRVEHDRRCGSPRRSPSRSRAAR